MKKQHKMSFTSPHILASLPENAPVLVAFSGGADSSALLHILKEDSKDLGYSLHAAHFNHRIRGDEAERDAEFCENICKSLDVPFHLGSADIPLLSKESGNSIEAEARERRYEFLEKVMRENQIPILVTAHHSEDQIESIMLHVLRGSSISGLCGIKECRNFSDGLFLVRPILHAQKEEILSYCKENNIKFVNDSTNTDTEYARNFIRTFITPKMREIQPNLENVFSRLSKSAADADDLIESLAQDFLKNECKPNIPLSKFNDLHTAIKARVLLLAFSKYSNGISLESTHINDVVELCNKGRAHSSVSLPKNIAAKIENDALVFAKDKEHINDESFCVPFTEGQLKLPNGIIIDIEKNPEQSTARSDVFLDVKCDIIENDAFFRSKNEGDLIFSGKMNKKVKKIISEKKIPLNMRRKLPLLVVNDEILWIPTVAVCDRIKRGKIKNGDSFYRISINFEN